MDSQQDSVVKLADKGHNIIVTGYPGTGKSYVIGGIVNSMLLNRKTVRITASTGKSALILQEKLKVYPYDECNSTVTTIHKFIGLLDGRFDNEELVRNLMQNEKFESQKQNILCTDVLIIDEVSMISCKLFEQIEFAMRGVRGNAQPFGGVQIIIAGDFFQLPPVASPEYNDDGSLLLESNILSYFHHIDLKVIHRQEEPDLVSAIHQLAIGQITSETRNLLTRLKRTLPPPAPGETTVKLFATNFDVDLHNANCLRDMEGEEHIYHSTDEGQVNGLQGVKALHLKIGCPVVLVVNLSNELVNGQSGIIREVYDNSVAVYFTSLNRTHVIKPFVFTKYSALLKRDIGSRTQLPLKLCFALTVHKSQGMTLDRVSVNCKNMFQYGQLTVAVSRAKTKKGLQILNFSDKLLKRPLPVISEFYALQMSPISEDFTCCVKGCETESSKSLHETQEMGRESLAATTQSDSDNDLGSEEEIELMKSMEDFDKICEQHQAKFPIPNDINIEQFLKNLTHDCVYTDEQRTENKAVSYLTSHLDDTKNFVQFLWDKLWSLKQEVFAEGQMVDNKTVTNFYKKYNTIVTGQEYQMKVQFLFGQNVTSGYHNTIFKLSSKIRSEILRIQAEPLRLEAIKKASEDKGKQFTESSGGRGKIRYIAGWCLSSMKKNRKKSVVNNMYNRKKVKIVEQSIAEKEFIEQLESEEPDITEKESLQEISRRQNLRKGLTVVSDECLNFFMLLDQKVRSLQSRSNLNLHGSRMSEFLTTSLHKDDELKTVWQSLFVAAETSKVNVTGTLVNLLNEAISKYTMMSIAQLRKEYLADQWTKKKEATRKQIKMKSDTSKEKCSQLTIASMKNDKTERKRSSHLRLQSEILKDNTYLECNFQKSDLLILCNAYGVLKGSKCIKTKKILADKLRSQILKCKDMINSVIFDPEHEAIATDKEITSKSQEPLSISLQEIDIPSTSNDPVITDTNVSADKEAVGKTVSRKSTKRRKTYGKGKGKKKKKTSSLWPCGICGDDASYNSVGCDGCDTWFHGDCLRIEDLDSLPDEWYCQTCTDEKTEC